MIKSKNDQLDLLRRTKGGENVRMSPEGEFIYRTTDDEGKQRDVLVDERGMGLKDFIDVLKEAPALALSIMTTKNIPVGSILKQALVGAGTYAGAAGLTEVGGRAAAGAPLEVGETIKRRGEEALTDCNGSAMDLGKPLMRSVLCRGSFAPPVLRSQCPQGKRLSQRSRGQGKVSVVEQAFPSKPRSAS
jgi:hypothetical protein